MVKTENGFRAHEYEHLAAADFKEPFQGRKLYAVEGLAGVFRRYPAPKKKEQIPAGALIAIFAGGVILLGKDEQLSAELGEGGWKHDGRAVEPPAAVLADEPDEHQPEPATAEPDPEPDPGIGTTAFEAEPPTEPDGPPDDPEDGMPGDWAG